MKLSSLSMGKEEREKEVLLNLLLAVIYRSRPVRWRLRRSLEQEKARLEGAQHEMQQLVKDLGLTTNHALARSLGITVEDSTRLLHENEVFVHELGVLVEALRPTVFHVKEGIEDVKARNDKLIRALLRAKKEREKKGEDDGSAQAA